MAESSFTIAVCFKIVPDYEELSVEEWAAPGPPDLAYVKKNFGCFDEAALETGLCLKDAFREEGLSARLIALTADSPAGAASEALLKSLYAAGCDGVVTLPDVPPFRQSAAAERLAGYLKKLQPDLILTGCASGPGDSGAVPFYLAKALSLPILTELTDVFPEHGTGRLLAKKKTIAQIETWALETPCLCTVGDAAHPYLRFFSLKARMEAQKKQIIKFEAGEEPLPPAAEILERPGALPVKTCVFPALNGPREAAVFLRNEMREALP